MKQLTRIAITAILAAAFLTGVQLDSASAQSKNKPVAAKKAKKPKKPKMKTFVFQGSDVTGKTLGPNGDTVVGRRDIKHTNLIRVRQNFLPELHKSAERL